MYRSPFVFCAHYCVNFVGDFVFSCILRQSFELGSSAVMITHNSKKHHRHELPELVLKDIKAVNDAEFVASK